MIEYRLKKIKWIKKGLIHFLDILLPIAKKISKRNISNENIVVVSLHKFGDTVLTFPTVNYLIKMYQDNLSVVCWYSTEGLYKMLNNNLRLIPVSERDFYFNGRIAKPKLRNKIRSLSPSKIIDLGGSITHFTAFALIKNQQIIGLTNEYFKRYYDLSTYERRTPHLSDKYFDVINLCDPVARIDDYRVKKVSKPDNCKILVHPTAGWAAKEWGFKKFVEMSEKLKSDGYLVEIVIESGRLLADEKELMIEKGIDFCELDSIDTLIQKIKDDSLVLIGNDSAAVHIADYFGRTTISIFGPTNPLYCKPVGDNNYSIQNIISCSPVGKNYCDKMAGLICDDYQCTKTLSVEHIYSEVNKIFGSLDKL